MAIPNVLDAYKKKSIIVLVIEGSYFDCYKENIAIFKDSIVYLFETTFKYQGKLNENALLYDISEREYIFDNTDHFQK